MHARARPGSSAAEARRATRTLAAAVAAVLLAACNSSTTPTLADIHLRDCDAAQAGAPTFRALVFTRTAAYHQASIPDGVAAMYELARVSGFAVDTTTDPSRFTDAGLAAYDVVVFLSTTGDVLNDAQQGAFERWMSAGHGWVGIHSATDTEYGWPFYQSMLGAHFTSHPAIQAALVVRADTGHVSTRAFPARLSRTDEWYNFNRQPAGAHVLLRLDEGSYGGGTMGATHPVAWYTTSSGGRAWYTAMGHTRESWRELPFLEHVRGGMLWAAGHESAVTCAL